MGTQATLGRLFYDFCLDGDGTALAIFYEHRISYDIDILLASADALTGLSPARNPATKALLGEHGYQFPGNYLKLELDSIPPLKAALPGAA